MLTAPADHTTPTATCCTLENRRNGVGPTHLQGWVPVTGDA
jgi:hypothetical protein